VTRVVAVDEWMSAMHFLLLFHQSPQTTNWCMYALTTDWQSGTCLNYWPTVWNMPSLQTNSLEHAFATDQQSGTCFFATDYWLVQHVL